MLHVVIFLVNPPFPLDGTIDILFEWPSMAVSFNKSGDVFILKSGGSSVHVTNRLLVAKFTLFGSCNNPSNKFYSQVKTKTGSEVKLSNHLSDLFISEDL